MLPRTMKHTSSLREEFLCGDEEGESHTNGSAPPYGLSMSGGNAVIPWIWKQKSRQCQRVRDLRAGQGPRLHSPFTSPGIRVVGGGGTEGCWSCQTSGESPPYGIWGTCRGGPDTPLGQKTYKTGSVAFWNSHLILLLLPYKFHFRVSFPL